MLERSPMNLPVPFVALALQLSESTDGTDSGSRTLIGTAVILVVLAAVVSVGVMMDRRARS
jgi:hypothetical protein